MASFQPAPIVQMTTPGEDGFDSGRQVTAVLAHSTPAVLRGFEQSAALAFEIDPLLDPRWPALVEQCSTSSVFHSVSWLLALRNVYGYDPVVVTTSAPGAPLTNGMVFCRIRSWLTGQRLVSLPFSDHCEPLITSQEDFDDLLVYLRRQVDTGNWKYAEIRPASFEPGSRTRFGRHLTYCFHSMDLTASPEQIFRRLHKDCAQRKIRRAEKENLIYEEGNSDLLLQKFYRLMMVTRRRQSLPPQPLAWFKGLIDSFGSSLKIRVASAGDRPVAGILTLLHKTSMTYKYGCSDAASNKLGGMALLFWKTIQDAKAAGCDQLDMGRSDCDNLGLIAFKDHWGAASTSLTYWKYPQQPAPQQKIWQHKLIKQIISATPQAALKAVGTLLYKHIG
jgi:CelD/BcsL family acetyltransferase involved in cellulose biosynthesis